MAKVVVELKKFCKTTSVAGVSRIVKTKEIFLKVIWTFFLLLCTGLLVYFLVALFIQYYKWPITTQFGEDLQNDIVFPDVTVCSLNKVVNDANVVQLKEDYFQYFDKEAILTNIDEIHNYTFDDLSVEYLHSIFYSLSSFIRILPKSNYLERDCPNVIAECRIYDKDWQLAQTCTENFTEIWNADYYSCFTIRTSQFNINESTTVRGMTLVLNNGPPSQEQIPYDVSLATSQGTEVKLTIHSPGSPPDLKKGISLAPGTETDISIIHTILERLNKPYNSRGCTNQEFMAYSSESYTQSHCIDYCIQNKIFKECGCVAHWFAIPESLENVYVCGNLSKAMIDHDYQREIRRINCSRNISKETSKCMVDCLIPCSEQKYTFVVSSTSWPQDTLQLGLYQRYFQNCIHDHPKVRERFAAYEYLTNLRKNYTSKIFSNKTYSLNDLKEVGESLLVVKLVIENDFPYIQIDKPLYTWDVMVGVVGGLLSLWLGISAVAVAELFELIYFLVKGCFLSDASGI